MKFVQGFVVAVTIALAGVLLLAQGGGGPAPAQIQAALRQFAISPTFGSITVTGACNGCSGTDFIIQEEGTPLTARAAMNFISANLLAADDAGNLRTNITLTATPTFTSVTSKLIVSGSTPAVANVGADSCGTTAATIAGNDNAGIVTVGATAGTQCRIAFVGTAATRRECAVSNETTAALVRAAYVDTTHSDLLGTFAAGAVLAYVCFAR